MIGSGSVIVILKCLFLKLHPLNLNISITPFWFCCYFVLCLAPSQNYFVVISFLPSFGVILPQMSLVNQFNIVDG